MRYEALTNMKTKTDKHGADILLYLSRCAQAIKNIIAPNGIKVNITVEAVGAQPKKSAKKAQEMYTDMSEQLGQADTAADRASRKTNRARTR
jgi:hypothetical protein